MNIKLAVFDLDGTLAEIGEPIEARTLAGLRMLEGMGVQLALSSGKPCAHLCGLLRQAGLPEVIMMGENGAVTQFGIDLPPRKQYRLAGSAEAAQHLAGIKSIIEQRIRPVPWFQPGEVVLTPFYEGQDEYLALKELLAEQVKPDMDLQVFEHADSFDICPKGIHKGQALRRLIQELELEKRQVAAVGDGENDLPLWQEAGLAIQIGNKVQAKVDLRVNSILEAIAAIRERLG